MWRWATLGLAGCSGLLGFEEPIVPPPASGDPVIFHLDRTNLENTPLLQVDEQTQPGTLEGITVQLADGSEPALEQGDDGTIRFLAPAGERYRLRFPTDRGNFELQTAAIEPRFTELVYGRADREQPSGPTIIRYDGLTPGFYGLMSTGVWTFGGVEQLTSGQQAVVDWSKKRIIGGPPSALVASTRHDRLHLGHYQVSMGTPVSTLELQDMTTDLVDMTSGGSIDLPFLSQPTSGDIHTFAVDPAASLAALDGVDSFATAQAFWTALVLATPSARRPDLGFTIAQALSTTDFQATEARLAVARQAFGYPTTVELFASRTREVLLDGRSRIFQLATAQVHTVEDGQRTDLAEVPLAVPSSFVLESTSLYGSDVAMPVLDPTRDPTLRWSEVAGAQLYSIDLLTLDDDGIEVPLRTFLTTETEVTIARELLSRGGSFLISFTALRGYPAAAAGDFSTHTMPYSFVAVGTAFQLPQ